MEAFGTRKVSVCSRYLWEERSLLVVLGDFARVAEGKAEYDALHGVAALPAAEAARLARLMAAAALAAVSLAERESWGWTMTSQGAAHGLFCAAEPEGLICGTSREAPREKAIACLQRKKGNGPLVESRFEPDPADPAASVERYFRKVEQIGTRLALDGTSGALVQALPGGALGELEAPGAGEIVSALRALRDGDRLRRLDEVAIFYECRCDDAVIRRMIDGLPAPSRAALWGAEARLEIACPRCGREFAIERGDGAFPETSGPNGR